ncbi:MAG: glycosyltransferase family 4 protein [Planctomycetota bacterium]
MSPSDNPLPQTPSPADRPRLLMSAFGCHPDQTMETRIGWRRALLAAEWCDVTVLVGPGQCNQEQRVEELTARACEERGTSHGLRFERVDYDWRSRQLCSLGSTYYLGYRHWGTLAYRTARRLHAERPFDLTHQVTYCGYREPGLLWKLPAPFVWGPVGGTQNFPLRYAGVVGPTAAAKEGVRSLVNGFQMRCNRRVRGAARNAAAVLAATTKNQEDLRRGLGLEADVELETGLDCDLAPPRRRRDASQPLRVLWAGRLQPWKALPLLLRSLPKLPADCPVEVRVLGDGPCRRPWQRLAERLGVGDRITWHDWPGYEETLPHYRWADVFAFTSLRDTSGTGLIESMAAGAPLVGVEHQGAADLMTDRCAVPVTVASPEATVRGFADALVTLATDHDLLHRLSHGARDRAATYAWEARRESTRLLYQKVLRHRALGQPMVSQPLSRSTGSSSSATLSAPGMAFDI